MARIYFIHYSEEDSEYVATCPDFPSLSYLHEDSVTAINGLKNIVTEYEIETLSLTDLHITKEPLNAKSR